MKQQRCRGLATRSAALVVLIAAFAALWAAPAAAQGPPTFCDPRPEDKPAIANGAKTEWSEPQCLSDSEANGEVPQAAIDEDGDAVAVWRVLDSRASTKFRVQFSTRERPGNFVEAPSPPGPGKPPDPTFNDRLNKTFLSSANADVGSHIRLDMNDAGDAIVVWEVDEGNGRVGIRSAFKPRNGKFEPEQVVANARTSGSAADSLVDPEVGIDGQGNATVIYHNPAPPFGTAPDHTSDYTSKTRPAGPGSSWADEKDVAPTPAHGHKEGSERDYNTETQASLAVDEQGNRRVVLTYQLFTEPIGPRSGGTRAGTPTTNPEVYELSRPAGAADWDDGCGTLGFGSEEKHSTLAAQEGGRTTAAFTHDGRILTTGDGYLRDFGGGPGGPSCSVNTDDASEPSDPPLATNTKSSGSDLEIDANGDSLLMWSTGSLLHANRLGAGNSRFFDPDADPVPGAGGNPRTRPALAPYDEAGMVSVFQEEVAGGDEDGDETVQAAIRPQGGTTEFDAPVRLSEDPTGTPRPSFEVEDSPTEDSTDNVASPFLNKKGTGPKVAANSDGEAVAAWSGQVKTQGGTTQFVVQVAILTPRDDPVIPPPPPPPAQPRPAVPSLIQLARPANSGEAFVLNLSPGAAGSSQGNSTQGATKLDWGFGTQNEPPVVGEVVNGNLERSVRLRLPDSSFTASAKVDTPDGPRTFTRNFAVPKPPSSAEAKEVLKGLKDVKPPPVFAIGKTEVLTATDKACAQLKIWTGQQKQSGCFKPIEGIPDIPGPERGALDELSKNLDLDGSKTKVMEQATKLTDGYVAEGRALLNDKFPVIPGGGASIVSIPQGEALISANAELPVGKASYDPKKGFNLKLDPKKAKIPLGKLPKPPKLPKLGGLEIVGDFDVDLEKQEAKIKASLVLPKEITKAGLKLENQVILRATPTDIIVDEVRVGPVDADIGALQVRDFKIEYKREGDEWLGQARATVAGAGIDIAPPNGSVRIKGGRLVFVGATINFPRPGIPIFKGVFLERIGFGTGFDPTRFTGSVGVGVLSIVSVDGRLLFAFPSSRTPYTFRRGEAGNEFPADFEGKQFTRTTIGAAGSVSVQIPVLGAVKLASGYALYEYPGYIAAGGGFDLNVLDIASLKGLIAGELDVDKEAFNLHGRIEACVVDIVCGSAAGNVSRGPNNIGGAGACVQVGPVSIGGGVQWNRVDDPFIWPLDGCKWSTFKIDVRSAAKARAAASASVIDVRRGAPSPAVKLFGRGGAPKVRVRGPGGQQLDASEKGLAMSPGGKIRILRFKGNKFSGPFTVVGVQNGQPGRYTVDALPGSPPITNTATTTDQPDAKVSGRVTGKGRRRVLRYDLRDREAQKVTFQEVTQGGASQVIGTTTRGGKGSFRFTSAPGGGRRKVTAQFELSGVPAELKRVTTFRPLTMRLARPRRLRVRHAGNNLRVRWRKVAGASRYEVLARLSGRRVAFKSTRRTRTTLRVPSWRSGRVFVRAIDDVRQSRTTSRRFRGKGKQPSPFRPLLSCRVTKTRIICTEQNKRCGGRTPTISASKGRRTVGTRRADVIAGSSGADRIDGRGGNDIICAGGGNDRVTGGTGNDLLQGEGGNDRITGSMGNDRIDGGAGNDRLKGGAGNDRILGGSGNDVVVGGAGRGLDTIDTGAGNDRVETRDRNARDRVNCGPGRDRARVDKVDSTRGCERR